MTFFAIFTFQKRKCFNHRIIHGKNSGGACLAIGMRKKFDGGGVLWYDWCDIIKGEE